MFIGLVSYYVYKLFARLKTSISSFIGGAAGSLTNTGLVFLMLYLVYAKEVVDAVGAPFKAIIISVFTSNAIAEAAVSAIITAVIVTVYKKYQKV
jgi:uncharacterized membrane protein